MRLQFLLPALKLQVFVLLFSKPNSLLLYDVLFCCTGSSPPWYTPSGCVKLFDAQGCQVYIFLVFPIFKQQQPPLQQPGGMCANSNSPAGSIAITEPLLYPCNCKGSCFLSDRTASLPPGETSFITSGSPR